MKKTTYALLSLFVLLLAVTSVKAIEKSNSATNKKVEAAEQKEQTFKDRCSATVKGKLKSKVGKSFTDEKRHLETYYNLRDRIAKFETKLASNGYDTTKLKADQKILDQKISKFGSDYSAYYSKLRELQNLGCEHAEGDFKNELSEVKSLLKTVHSDAADIRDFYRTVLKADIKEIRTQKPKEVESTEDNKTVTPAQ